MCKQRWRIKFKIDPNRYMWKKIKKPPKPIKRSRYAELLFREGAGWKK